MLRTLPLALAAALLAPAAARAHFPFLSVSDEGQTPTLRLVFGESADADDPKYLPILQKAVVTRHAPGGGSGAVELKPDGGALTADVSADPAGTAYTLVLDYGVMNRGGESFRLKYDAAAVRGPRPAAPPAAWTARPLAIVPGPGGRLTALANGKPLPGATIHVLGDLGGEELTADDAGTVTLSAAQIADAGVMSVRTNRTEPGAGVYEGKQYPETRRYATAVFTPADLAPAADPAADPAAPAPDAPGKSAPEKNAAAPAGGLSVEPAPAAELPEGVTSFGAAVSGGFLYYYGGHPGTPHKYSTDEQSGAFRRLKLDDPAAGWEELPGGPKLQGLALVPHPGGGVLRIGGFTARNAIDEEHDLHSMPTVARYNPTKGEWEDLPALPGGRSSFDAAVLNGKVYVLGGWMMAGAEGEAWHATGYVADLTADEPEWETLPAPPAPRRGERRRRRPRSGRGRPRLSHRRDDPGGRNDPPRGYLRRGERNLDPRPGPARRRHGRLRRRRPRRQRGGVRHDAHRHGPAPRPGRGRLGGVGRTGEPPLLPPPAPGPRRERQAGVPAARRRQHGARPLHRGRTADDRKVTPRPSSGGSAKPPRG